jgi:NADP-dependent 3-hydroxy acid dehydrogenase YdfG
VAKFIVQQNSLNKLILVSRTIPADSYIQSAIEENQVKLVQQDLSDAKEAGKVVEAAIKEFGQLDGLVLNHGTLSPVKRISVDGGNVGDWKKAFDINFFSALSIVSLSNPV